MHELVRPLLYSVFSSRNKNTDLTSHANAHCIMKVLKGQLKETRYLWPTVQLNNGDHTPLQIETEKVYGENEVTYMSDKLGLHKISNPNPEEYAVSLHCTSFCLWVCL